MYNDINASNAESVSCDQFWGVDGMWSVLKCYWIGTSNPWISVGTTTFPLTANSEANLFGRIVSASRFTTVADDAFARTSTAR